MRIASLHSKNFKGAIDVQIAASSTNIIVIGGRNAQGKTSALDSIEAALCGAKSAPGVPVRKGASKAEISIRIERPEGDLIVERTFTENGTRLVVKSEDGAVYSKPQQLLESFIGAVGFDPHAFTRLDAKKQADQLRRLVELDFTSLDERRRTLYDERTSVNRSAAKQQTLFDSMRSYPDAPAEPVSVAMLVDELRRRERVNRENEDHCTGLRNEESLASSIRDDIAEIEMKIAELQDALDSRREHLVNVENRVALLKTSGEALSDENVKEINEQIATAEDTNRKVAANKAHASAKRDLDDAKAESKSLTEMIDHIDAEKARQLKEAPWPVAGLGFDEEGRVTFNGLPFSQASTAEQLRVSLAIGMALNPKLRVLICRDGSLIDDETMSLIREEIERNDFQLWIEKVSSDGKGCSLVISEGRVVEHEPQPAMSA